jgi:hypothetical protein
VEKTAIEMANAVIAERMLSAMAMAVTKLERSIRECPLRNPVRIDGERLNRS